MRMYTWVTLFISLVSFLTPIGRIMLSFHNLVGTSPRGNQIAKPRRVRNVTCLLHIIPTQIKTNYTTVTIYFNKYVLYSQGYVAYNFYIYLVINISIIDLSIFYGYHIFNLLPLWLNNIFHATVLFVYLRQFRITAVFFSM